MCAIDRLKEYKLNSTKINRELRNGAENPELCAIDELFSDIEVPPILYRILDNQYVRIEGEFFCDPAYLSCTDNVDEFICKTDPTNHLGCMRIQLSSPFRSINMAKLLPDFNGEGEFLLPRNLRLRIVNQIDYNGIEEFNSFLELTDSCTGSKELNEYNIQTITLYTFEVAN